MLSNDKCFLTGSDNAVLNNPGSMCETCTHQKSSCPVCGKNPLLMFNEGLFGECLPFGRLFSYQSFCGMTELGGLERNIWFCPHSLQMRNLKFRVVK